jgi:hypothetical protein
MGRRRGNAARWDELDGGRDDGICFQDGDLRVFSVGAELGALEGRWPDVPRSKDGRG